MTEDLDPEVVHLWLALEPPQPNARLAAACHEVMSDDERQRELDFVFEKDRRLFRLARALTRTVLSRYAPVDPRAWVFDRTSNGRPFVAAPSEVVLDFSLSHSPGVAALLVGTGRRIGVDVENAARFGDGTPPIGLLGPSELADVQSTPCDRQAQRFLEYWTLKESYAKARGTGLSISLDRCEFTIGKDTISATIDPSLDPEPDGWWFRLVPTTKDFVTAVAVSLTQLGVPRLEVHTIDPLQAF